MHCIKEARLHAGLFFVKMTLVIFHVVRTHCRRTNFFASVVLRSAASAVALDANLPHMKLRLLFKKCLRHALEMESQQAVANPANRELPCLDAQENLRSLSDLSAKRETAIGKSCKRVDLVYGNMNLFFSFDENVTHAEALRIFNQNQLLAFELTARRVAAM